MRLQTRHSLCVILPTLFHWYIWFYTTVTTSLWCILDASMMSVHVYNALDWCSVQMLLHNPALVECARSRCCGDQVTYTFMAMAITYFGYRVCRWLLGHLFHDYNLHDSSSSRLQPRPLILKIVFLLPTCTFFLVHRRVQTIFTALCATLHIWDFNNMYSRSTCRT